MAGSAPFSINTTEVLASLRGLLYTLAGAAAVWLLGQAAILQPTDATNVIYITLLSGAANILKQFVSDNTKP